MFNGSLFIVTLDKNVTVSNVTLTMTIQPQGGSMSSLANK